MVSTLSSSFCNSTHYKVECPLQSTPLPNVLQVTIVQISQIFVNAQLGPGGDVNHGLRELLDTRKPATQHSSMYVITHGNIMTALAPYGLWSVTMKKSDDIG
jgi:hypothetical protein